MPDVTNVADVVAPPIDAGIDSGIDAGALQPMGIPKQLRIQELALENKLPYVQLVESAGATEGAPAGGTAELIVDITTTGATLAANGLKVLDDGVILKSHANLVASRDADWSRDALETARIILDHIHARARASEYSEVRTRFKGCNATMLAEAHNRFGVVAPFGGPTSSGMLTLHCPPAELYWLVSFLRVGGADTISVASLDYVFDRENPLFARLEAFLKA